MDTSSKNNVNILELPDEILLVIFNKLNEIDALYSLVDVNKRFDRLVLNSLGIRTLDMTKSVIKSYYDRTFSLDNNFLEKICEQILPQIRHKLNELIVEQNSMKHVFPHTYPQLDSLSFVNFEKEILYQYLTDSRHSILHHLLAEQIQHVNIDVPYDPKIKSSKVLSSIFVLILSGCKRLISLNFCQLFYDRKTPICIFDLPSTSYTSSTLTKLKINVRTFNDCLYLLDGNLKCLSTLIIHVERISPSILTKTQKQLPELKCFSLSSLQVTIDFEREIVPLLRRMTNLKELILFLSVIKNHGSYIDGIELHNEIIISIPELNKFKFSIHTFLINNDIEMNLPSNEDIQRSFIGKGFGQVGSCLQRSPEDNVGRLHVYSLPYQFQYFLHLNNSFQGDMFDTVEYLTMDGRFPFEYNLFKLISQCFPRLKELLVANDEAQKMKKYSSTLIVFPHLILLNLAEAHVDYAEQLLCDKNTHLPALLDLCIEYKSLAIITNNFTNDTICRNCAKIKRLHTNSFLPPENFHQYFPLLKKNISFF